jgi:hypothetical protein
MLKSGETQRTVRNNLDNMKKHLRIFLLEHTEQVQFCIHNANKDAAICYLRYSRDQFVEWCIDEDARKMASKLRRKRPQSPYSQVFNGSKSFDLYSEEQTKKEFKESLWLSTERMFPRDFGEQLRDVCFGNNSN